MAAKPKARPKKQDDLGGAILSTKGMAALLGITPRWLNKLVNEGEVTPIGRGQFDPYATVQAYAEFLKKGQERASASENLESLREAKVQEVRIRLHKQDRTLIHIDEATAVFDEMAGLFLAYLSGLPAEITNNRKERARIDGIIDVGRARLSDRFIKKAATLASGREDPDTEAEVDT